MLEKRIAELKSIEDRFLKLSSFEHFSFYKELKEIQNTIDFRQVELLDFSNNLNNVFNKFKSNYYLKLESNGLFLYQNLKQLIWYSFDNKKFTIYGREFLQLDDLNEFIEITIAFQEEFKKNKEVFEKNYSLIFSNLEHIKNFLNYKENEKYIKKITYLKNYLKINFKRYKKINPVDNTKKQKAYHIHFEKNSIYFENIWASKDVITHCNSDHSYIFINYEDEKTFKLELEFLPQIVNNKIDIDLLYNFVMTKKQIEEF